jgi:hypothetical protein
VTVYNDNPAGRLYELLKRFKESANPSANAMAWAKVLGYRSPDSPAFPRHFGLVYRLPDEIYAELAEISDSEYDPETVTRWRPAVEGVLRAIFTGTPGKQVASGLNDASMLSLESCSFVLHRHRPQLVLPDSDHQRIDGLIKELLHELTDSNETALDPELREFLVAQCSVMRNALRDVAIRGPAALEDALDQVWGAANRRADLAVRTGTEPNRSAWRKFREVIVVVGAVFQVATSAAALPGQVQQAIEGPQPPAQVQVEVVVSEPGQSPTADTAAQHPNGAGTHSQATGGAPS